MNGEALFARHQARAARHRPALQHAIEFKPEIVMQPRRIVFLHDKRMTAAAALGATRLQCDVKIALFVIGLERHASSAFQLAFLTRRFAADFAGTAFLAVACAFADVLPLVRRPDSASTLRRRAPSD